MNLQTSQKRLYAKMMKAGETSSNLLRILSKIVEKGEDIAALLVADLLGFHTP